jgi:hypothetical protein
MQRSQQNDGIPFRGQAQIPQVSVESVACLARLSACSSHSWQSLPSIVENTIPVLPVRRLAASARFLRLSIFGFPPNWSDAEQGTVCSVSRDGGPIMLLGLGGDGQIFLPNGDQRSVAPRRVIGLKIHPHGTDERVRH